ncbi:site-specific integrase [Lactobacillus intestinalis]|uniref:site-specific integrase n=2 Tax=Lactobacillus intestinalis TaxID=151781 RepID=UPI00262F0E6F|nr:site-specific integrase [Lactobacillus intestinalis]
MGKPYRKNGSWAIRVNWTDYTDLDENGKPKYKQKVKQGFLTKTAAKKWERDQKYKLEHNLTSASPKVPSFGGYFKQWSEIYRKPSITDITWEKYETLRRLLDRKFGKIPITQIKRTDYQVFITEYAQTHVQSTTNRTKDYIYSALQSAVADKIIPINFAEGAEAKGNNDRKLKIVYPSVAQVKKILNYAINTRNPNNPINYEIITAILTGMRFGEVEGLTWDKIDFKKHTISITRAYDYKHDKMFKPLKNPWSKRTIRVDNQLLNYLSELKYKNYKLVFGTSNTTALTPKIVTHHLRKILKSCGLNLGDFHFHSLRHCHVALLHAMHIDWYAISKRLGHKSLQTTLDTYAYLMEEERKRNDSLIEQNIDKFLSTEKDTEFEQSTVISKDLK